MQRIAILLTAALILVGIEPAHAEPITFTDTFTASGKIGSTTFTNQTVTFSYATDTTDISSNFQSQSGEYGIAIASLTGTIGSTSFSLTFTTDLYTYNGSVDFLDGLQTTSIAGTSSSQFNGYELMSSIGPVTGSTIANTGSGNEFATSAGEIYYTSVSNSTFTASTPSAVPEPASLAMCGMGGLIVSAYAWRRRRRAATA